MKKINFIYLPIIAGIDIGSFEEIFKNKRLYKNLWMEFILNPEIAKAAQRYLNNPVIKNGLIKALSWYFSFKWLFKKNPPLEKLKKNRVLIPTPIREVIYIKDRRNFLKGIIYAGLC